MQQELQAPIEPIWGIKPKAISQMNNLDVLEQHLDEIEFLWMQHQNMALRPDILLDDLTEQDDYLQANLDGVILSGETGWALCEERLTNDSDEIFTAAYIAFISERFDWIDKVLEKVNEDNELSFIGALGWLDYDKAESFISILLEHEKAYFNYLGLAVCLLHRRIPSDIDLLVFLNSDVMLLKQITLRLIGGLKLRAYRKYLHPYLINPELYLRLEAAYALALLGERGSVLPVLTVFTSKSSQYQRKALQILLRISDEATQKQLIDSLIYLGDLRAAIIAVGITGYKDYVPWLISMMQQPELAKLCGESFCFITGIDIEYLDLVIEEPEQDDGDFDDEEEDDDDDSIDDLIVDDDDDENEVNEWDEYEEDLARPDPALIADWWKQYHRDYQDGERYLAGKLINETNLLDVYKTGFQRQRTAAALELALLSPDNVWLNTSISADKQMNVIFKTA